MIDNRTIKIGPGVELPISVVTSKAAILAMTGAGKSHLAKVMAEEMMKHGAQIVVADYLGVWWGLTSSASGKRAGANVVVFGGDHADVPINEHSGALVADVVVKERINAVLDVSGWEDDAPKIRFVNAFARRLFHINKRPMHLFIDEADEFVPQTPQREQIAMFAILKRIWQRGRIKGIGGTLISQRSALLNKSLLSQSEILIALNTVGPQDRAALALWFDSWGTPVQIAEFNRTISNLPQHHAWFWSPRHKLFLISKARALETFDTGGTPDVAKDIEPPKARTKHDLSKLGEEIQAAAIEEKRNDPAFLRKENAELRAALLSDKRALVVKENTRVRTERIPVMNDKSIKRVEAAIAQIGKIRQSFETLVSGGLQAFVSTFDTTTRELRAELERVSRLVSEGPPPPVQETPRAATPEPTTMSRVRTRGSSPGTVSGGKARILVVLAQHGKSSTGRIRVLAVIESTHTLSTYLQQLRRDGWIAGDPPEITAAGKEALGSWEPLPTGRALVDYWRGQLGTGGLGRIFGVLLDAGVPISKEELARRAKIMSADTLNTYTQKLQRLGLAVSNSGGVKISDDFDGLI